MPVSSSLSCGTLLHSLRVSGVQPKGQRCPGPGRPHHSPQRVPAHTAAQGEDRGGLTRGMPATHTEGEANRGRARQGGGRGGPSNPVPRTLSFACASQCEWPSLCSHQCVPSLRIDIHKSRQPSNHAFSPRTHTVYRLHVRIGRSCAQMLRAAGTRHTSLLLVTVPTCAISINLG